MSTSLTLDDLSKSDLDNMRFIALGINLEYRAWERLFNMGLVESDPDAEDEPRDFLTEQGQQLLGESMVR